MQKQAMLALAVAVMPLGACGDDTRRFNPPATPSAQPAPAENCGLDANKVCGPNEHSL